MKELTRDSSPLCIVRAAMMRSFSFQGSARWIFFQLRKRTDDDFISLLKLRLGIHDHNRGCTLCPGCTKRDGSPRDISLDPLHALHCVANSDLRNRKHNIIRDKLWALIKEVQFGDQVRTEVDFADGGFGVRPDVLVTFFNAKIILIDITVVNPAAPTYAMPASARNNFTSRIAGKRKLEKYLKLLMLQDAEKYEIIPFAIETTGRLGFHATNFLNRIADQNIPLISKFVGEIFDILMFYQLHQFENLYLSSINDSGLPPVIPPASSIIDFPDSISEPDSLVSDDDNNEPTLESRDLFYRDHSNINVAGSEAEVPVLDNGLSIPAVTGIPPSYKNSSKTPYCF